MQADSKYLCSFSNILVTREQGEALSLLSEEVHTSEVLFPPAEVIAAGEFQTDIGEALVIY